MNRSARGSGSGPEPQESSAATAAAAPNGSSTTPLSGGATAAKHGRSNGEVIDAGLKSLEHYKRALPRWRYRLRQRVLPLIRWETPYLAYLQDKMRSPALDSYFAITANLGTHTFFMIGLPIMFWCGFRDFGLALVHILAAGVFLTGFLKDMLSLPRPLSPPLQRITMSGSAALEYGFPSTHSANAVSVVVLALLMLHEPDNSLAPTTKLILEGLSYWFAASIVLGRLYCGMHGFLDVIVGSLMGAAISWVEYFYVPVLEAVMLESDWRAPIYFSLAIIILVRIHSEPADDCPCFDDSVAFAGVVIGVESGFWRYEHAGVARPIFTLQELGLPVVLARLASGIFVIFAWREVMKPALLRVLPYLFRRLETRDLSLPRRFFVRASEYGSIPDLLRLHTDTVIPSISDFPEIVRNIRRAGRGRSVSIGPQSAADAYEALAYRERRRRESMGSNSGGVRNRPSLRDLREEQDGGPASSPAPSEGVPRDDDRVGRSSHVSGLHVAQPSPLKTPSPARRHQNHHQHHPSTLAEYESMMGQGAMVVGGDEAVEGEEPDIYITRQDELSEKEIFEKLVKPRVRYDVEVVTKLVVYAGIGWLSVDWIPVMFEIIGLGVR